MDHCEFLDRLSSSDIVLADHDFCPTRRGLLLASLLAALPWHGNVIELRALLENIVNAPQTARTIALDDVVSRLHLNGSSPVPRGASLKAARAQFEREYIAAAIEDSHGRISAAAEVLGLRRTNLYRKIRSLRISEGSPFRS